MSQAHRLLDLFHEHKNILTLSQILDAKISSKYTNRISELRRMGYNVVCEKDVENPMENIYKLFEHQNSQFNLFEIPENQHEIYP